MIDNCTAFSAGSGNLDLAQTFWPGSFFPLSEQHGMVVLVAGGYDSNGNVLASAELGHRHR